MTNTEHTSSLNEEEWLNGGGYRILDHVVCTLNVVNDVANSSIKLL